MMSGSGSSSGKSVGKNVLIAAIWMVVFFPSSRPPRAEEAKNVNPPKAITLKSDGSSLPQAKTMQPSIPGSGFGRTEGGGTDASTGLSVLRIEKVAIPTPLAAAPWTYAAPELSNAEKQVEQSQDYLILGTTLRQPPLRTILLVSPTRSLGTFEHETAAQAEMANSERAYYLSKYCSPCNGYYYYFGH